MNKNFFLLLLIFTSFLSGCVSSLSKVSIENVKFVKLISANLTCSEVMLSIDFDNGMNKNFNIIDVQIISNDIENLMISLSSPVCLSHGKSTVEVPLAVNYSLGSALTLLNLMKKGGNNDYSFLINLKYSKEGNKRVSKFSFKKKFSQDELFSLITKLGK